MSLNKWSLTAYLCTILLTSSCAYDFDSQSNLCGNAEVGVDEACDDANSKGGDGCSTTCQIEDGYTYTTVIPPPESISIPVIYRDFRSYRDTSTPSGDKDGYITQAYINTLPQAECIFNNSSGPPIGFRLDAGHTDFENIYDTQNGLDKLVNDTLGKNGKPVFNKTGAGDELGQRQLTCKESFDMWFNDTPSINRTLPYHLNLALLEKPVGESGSSETYVFDIADPTYGGK